MNKVKLKIDGMACTMCEAHVNDAIRRLVPNAKRVKSSHSMGVAEFLCDDVPDRSALACAISETGYRMLGFETVPYTKRTWFFFR